MKAGKSQLNLVHETKKTEKKEQNLKQKQKMPCPEIRGTVSVSSTVQAYIITFNQLLSNSFIYLHVFHGNRIITTDWLTSFHSMLLFWKNKLPGP